MTLLFLFFCLCRDQWNCQEHEQNTDALDTRDALSQNERRRLFDHNLHSYRTTLAEVRGYEQDATP